MKKIKILNMSLVTASVMLLGSVVSAFDIDLKGQQEKLKKSREQLVDLQKTLPQFAQTLKSKTLVKIDDIQKSLDSQKEYIVKADDILNHPFDEIKKLPVYLLTLQGLRTVPAGQLLRDPLLSKVLEKITADVTAQIAYTLQLEAALPLMRHLRETVDLVTNKLLDPLKKGLVPMIQALDPESAPGKELYGNMQKAINELAVVDKAMTEFARYEALFKKLAVIMGF